MSPEILAPLFFLAAALLAAAGAAKLVRPGSIAQALYAAGLPGSAWVARAIAAAEVLVGVAALARPSWLTALGLAGTYLAFAVFVAYLKVARPASTSCGCAGGHDVPPSWLHVCLNLLAVAIAVTAVAVGMPSAWAFASSLGWAAVPAVAGLAVAGWLLTVVVAEVPAALSVWTAPSHHEQELFDPDRHRRADVALSTAGVGPGHPSLWPETDVPHPGDLPA